MSWEPVIGLEIHVQLKTRTKMFCRCPSGYGVGGGENTQTCPVCLGFPGQGFVRLYEYKVSIRFTCAQQCWDRTQQNA